MGLAPEIKLMMMIWLAYIVAPSNRNSLGVNKTRIYRVTKVHMPPSTQLNSTQLKFIKKR